MSVPKKFIEQAGFIPDPGQNKVIFPTPRTRRERELIGALIDNISQVEISRERAQKEAEELKAKAEKEKDVAVQVEALLKQAVLDSHPTLLGIGGLTSSEFVKGQEELKNKGLEELSKRKVADIYQMAKAKELEND